VGAGLNIDARDCIFWHDTAPIGKEIEVDSDFDISYSDVEGGQASVNVGTGTLTWGSGMIDADPMFVNATRQDFALQEGSPCSDAGDPSADIVCDALDVAGDPRLLDGLLTGTKVVDIGAREHGNVHIAVVKREPAAATMRSTSSPEIVLSTSGKVGLPVMMFVGTKEGFLCDRRFGPLFVDLSSPWWVVPLGRIPSVVAARLPDLPGPVTLILQALAIDTSASAGNFSRTIGLNLP
jgi:hypothetical protein